MYSFCSMHLYRLMCWNAVISYISHNVINTWPERAAPLSAAGAGFCSASLKAQGITWGPVQTPSILGAGCVHWPSFVILALWKLVREDQQFKASVSYWARHCLGSREDEWAWKHMWYFQRYCILFIKKARWLMDGRQYNESILENRVFFWDIY